MIKKVNIIKRMLVFIMVVLLSMNSFAAIVSDNDGKAFVTKGEFDALKNSFAKQISDYNQSLDDKLDGAIAEYLAGRSNKSERISFICADSSFDNTIKFRQDWQKLYYGAWGNNFKAMIWGVRNTYCPTNIPMSMSGTALNVCTNPTSGAQNGLYFILSKQDGVDWAGRILPTLACKLTNNACNDYAPAWQESKKPSSNVSTDPNFFWPLGDYDKKDVVDPANTRVYLPDGAQCRRYQQMFSWLGAYYKYGNNWIYYAHDEHVNFNYTKTAPGSVELELVLGHTNTASTIAHKWDFVAVADWTQLTSGLNLSTQGAGDMSLTYMIGGKMSTTDEILGIVEAKQNDWSDPNFITSTPAQKTWHSDDVIVNGLKPGSTTPISQDSSGATGAHFNDYCLINYYFSSSGPQKVTKKCSELMVKKLTDTMGEPVYYYSGIPLCTVDKPEKVHISFDLKYNNPGGYGDPQSVIAIKEGQFGNYEFTDTVGGKPYYEQFEYYQPYTRTTHFDITIDYTTLTTAKDKVTLWLKLKPNHGPSGQPATNLITVWPTNVSIVNEFI